MGTAKLPRVPLIVILSRPRFHHKPADSTHTKLTKSNSVAISPKHLSQTHQIPAQCQAACVLFFYVVHYLCLLSMKCPKKTCVQLYIRVCVSSFFYIGEMGRKKDKLVEKNFDF